MSWSEDDIASLKRHWAAGKTASQIADLIPGKTRNAILGMVRRLGLAARVKGGNATARKFGMIVERIADEFETLPVAAFNARMPIAEARTRWAALVARYDLGQPVTDRDDVEMPVRALDKPMLTAPFSGTGRR